MREKTRHSRKIIAAFILIACITAFAYVRQPSAQQQNYFFSFQIGYSLPGMEDLFDMMKPHLQEIGIDFKYYWITSSARYELTWSSGATYDEGGWDAMASSIYQLDAPEDWTLYYHSTGGRRPAFTMADTEVDKLLEKTLVTMDKQERRDVVWELQEILYDLQPMIILYSADYIDIFSTNVDTESISKAAEYTAFAARGPQFRAALMEIPGENRFTYAQFWWDATDLIPAISKNPPSIWAQFSNLVIKNPNGTVGPDLAESWEWSDDFLTITFHLRDGLVWSDGVPLTSEDVKFTFDTIKNNELCYAHAPFSEVVDSIEAPNNRTVILHLKKNSAVLLAGIIGGAGTAIMPRHILEEIPFEDWATHDLNLKPGLPSCGPWVRTEEVQDEYILHEANELFYGWGLDPFPDAPNFDEFIFKIIPEASTALMACETAEINWASSWYAYMPQYGEIKDNPNLKYTIQPTYLNFAFLHHNRNHPQLNNKWVRKAISYAIPREEYVEKVLQGLAEATSVPFSPTYTPYWYNTELEDPYPFDLEKAKESMEKAGYDYDWLISQPIPYLNYVAYIAVGAVVGIVVGIFAGRKRWRKASE